MDHLQALRARRKHEQEMYPYKLLAPSPAGGTCSGTVTQQRERGMRHGLVFFDSIAPLLPKCNVIVRWCDAVNGFVEGSWGLRR
jgi:hypothetical protein